MYSESKNNSPNTQNVSKTELNSWRRGFTYQAEIWNGRMAIAGLFLLSIILFAANYFFSG
ncbi:high light inducible protein [Prochlorococcus sp. MIT 1223]|uniref:high light inducible protein n=1 Tax=Prochlorococcus sp. MIT 1223 TaxID=3096217 RepID=UPI002A757376|nr:high light inducible protein [Prochlorococcus sp. MIT 1223]